MRVIELESEAPAVKALGSLFKLTEVFLWDDDSVETREKVTFHELTDNLDENRSDAVFLTVDCSPLPDDVELAGQMSLLGLPLSFKTNKERRNVMGKGKRKDTNKKQLHHDEGSHGKLDSIEVSEGEVASSTVFHDKKSDCLCCTSMLSQRESSFCDIAADINKTHCLSGMEEDLENLGARITCVAVEEQLCDGVSGILSNHSLDCGSEHSSVLFNNNMKTEASPNSSDAGTSLRSITADNDTDHHKKEHDGGSTEFACMEGSLVFDGDSEGKKFYSDICIEQPQGTDVVADSQYSEVLDHDETDNKDYGDLGDWTSHWDSFYMRNYFYNTITHESTWNHPLGMEHLVFGEVVEKPEEVTGEVNPFGEAKNDDKSVDLLRCEPSLGYAGDNFHDLMTIPTTLNCSSEQLDENKGIKKNCSDENSSSALTKTLSEDNWNGNMLLETRDRATDKLETKDTCVAGKLKKKARKRTRLNKTLSSDSGELQVQGIVEDFSPSISKYWCQRYLLFSRFDEGIRMDEEGWFSVTPESIARHHALRCGTGLIVDCFTGVGGNAIQFAKRSKHVVAIDIDPKKIDYAQHNATIYGVDDRIDFIRGDSFLLAPRLKADTVFLSPPWGGPDYAKVTTYDIKTMLKPHEGHVLFNAARGIAPKVVMFLPRNVDLNQLAELSLSADPPWSLEVEKNFLNGKLKAITAYFTDTSA